MTLELTEKEKGFLIEDLTLLLSVLIERKHPDIEKIKTILSKVTSDDFDLLELNLLESHLMELRRWYRRKEPNHSDPAKVEGILRKLKLVIN
jgi:hypothetical protein